MITLAYIILYLLGALIGMFYGYPFLKALFESTSAAANVGLSCGITSVDMPLGLKITYIIQMWIGRLEFTSVFTIVGFLFACLKGKK
jgi:trk system potassium uptake protein TrkH